MEEFINNWDHIDPLAKALIGGAIVGFVFAARKIIGWAIIIIGLFFALVFALDGPVRDTLNDHCDQCGDKFIWYSIDQWFPANEGKTFENYKQDEEEES